MPKINRSQTTYVKLPEMLQTSTLSEAKIQASLNITVPKELEKKAKKIMEDIHDEIAAEFKEAMKKAIRKCREDD